MKKAADDLQFSLKNGHDYVFLIVASMEGP